MTKQVTFTRQGAFTGAKQILPIALSVFSYGTVFGVLARQAGISLVEAIAMSSLVFAGSAQFIVLGFWSTPLPIVTIVITTLIVNLRHLLMGMALRPWFVYLKPAQAYLSAIFMSDENWALTMREFRAADRASSTNGAFLLGSGLMLFGAWVSATATGHLVGFALGDPIEWGLDFAFPAVFIALLAGFWRGKLDLLPWGVAVTVAITASIWLPGKWYILLGGIAGSLVGAFCEEPDAE
ncbi:AzlC family ABC transporter permease [Chloroflexi bacterium TSY]|nr:AzlC family ABC transporter permease [Chloroflexi bacterium TSY]